MEPRRLRIAVDVGGTFTDATLWDPRDSRLVAEKVLTTPADRAVGVLESIDAAIAAAGAGLDEVAEVVHGSTTGTNALIERTGAKVGLLTTEGFRDVLEIGRIMRPEAGLYDFSVDLPPPLVPRYLRLEARERLDADGRVLIPLDESSVAEAGGADALVVANALLGMAIDVESFRPKLGNLMGGLTGPAFKPVILRMVYQCARAVGLPVIGCGGISGVEDAVEYMLAGATAVQVGTVNFVHPARMIEIIEALPNFLRRQGLTRVSDLTGAMRAAAADSLWAAVG